MNSLRQSLADILKKEEDLLYKYIEDNKEVLSSLPRLAFLTRFRNKEYGDKIDRVSIKTGNLSIGQIPDFRGKSYNHEINCITLKLSTTYAKTKVNIRGIINRLNEDSSFDYLNFKDIHEKSSAFLNRAYNIDDLFINSNINRENRRIACNKYTKLIIRESQIHKHIYELTYEDFLIHLGSNSTVFNISEDEFNEIKHGVIVDMTINSLKS